MEGSTAVRSVCVYCGSSKGFESVYEEQAAELGVALAQKGFDIVYGAGSVGLMGVLADAALQEEGRVIGIIPSFLMEYEVYHKGIAELHEVPDMQIRKRMMMDKSDAFVMMPGGFGTLEEFFEVLTWKQLHLHQKPIGILNVNGYFDPMLEFMDQMVKAGFVKEQNLNLFGVAKDVPSLLEYLSSPPAQAAEKWITP